MLEFTVSSFNHHYGTKLGPSGISWLWSITVTSYQIGAVLGAIAMTWFLERLGRRDTIMIFAQALFIIGCLCMALAKPAGAFELLVLGRLLFGFGIGTASWYVFVTECAPDKYRGEASTLVSLGNYVWILIGTFMALPSTLGTSERWPLFCLVPIIPSAVYMAFAWRLPRSPKWLYISRRRTGDAILAIRYYYGHDTDTDAVLAEFDRESALLARAPTASLRRIWSTRTLRYSFVVCMLAACAQCFSGETVGTAYSNGIYQSFGISQTGSVVLLGLLIIVKIGLGVIVSLFLIERIGRRPLLLGGAVCACVGMALVFGAELTNFQSKVSASTAISIVGYFFIIMGDVLGLLSIPALLVSEMTPQVRHGWCLTATCFYTLVQGLNLIQTLGFPPLYTSWGGYAFLPILILEIACVILLYHYLPETRGRTIDDIVSHLPSDLQWSHARDDGLGHDGERTPLIGSLAMGAEVEIRKRSRPPGLGFGTSVPASSSTIDSAMLRQQSAPPALESDFNST